MKTYSIHLRYMIDGDYEECIIESVADNAQKAVDSVKRRLKRDAENYDLSLSHVVVKGIKVIK